MRYERYVDSVLVEVLDWRSVSKCAARRKSEIKGRCAESIDQTGIRWMVEREISGGKPVPPDVREHCALLRQLSNELEARIQRIVAQAASDDDKVACDAIEAVQWIEPDMAGAVGV